MLAALYVYSEVSTPQEEAWLPRSGDGMDVCMASEGFEWILEGAEDDDPRYLLDSAEFAAEWGFGIMANQLGIYPGQDAINEQMTYVNNLSDGQQDAWYAARDRCTEETTTPGSYHYWLTFQAAFVDFAAVLDDDETVRSPLDQWRSCMAESGYDYDSPRSMRDWFQAADDDSARAAIADHLDEFKSMLQTVEVDGDSHG